MWKAFEKQTRTIEDQINQQVNILKTVKPKDLETVEGRSDVNEKRLKYKEDFNELSNKRIREIYNTSKEINFTNSTYHFKGSNRINFILICLMHQ